MLPLVSPGLPGSSVKTLLSSQVPNRQYRPIAWIKAEGEQPSLRMRRTAPAGGAKRGPPRFQGTPERARLIEPVMATNRTRLSDRWSAHLPGWEPAG